MCLKKWLSGFLFLLLPLFTFSLPTLAFTVESRSAVLMDAITGQVLYRQNENERLPPASVTKVMTMLLIMEALEKKQIRWDTPITTTATAAGMGGSQVYLKEGEQFSLRDMFKAIAIVSANDASTAVAEYLYGSVTDFIDAMNKKAQALGLENTHFANETGLPEQGHFSSAYDLAVLSRELIKYPEVLKFTAVWLDSFREGKFILRNTNELIKVYEYADGLKTGFTEEAGYCLSATAKKNGFRLISVILGTKSNTARIRESKRLLEYGYRTFERKILYQKGTEVGEVFIEEAKPQKIQVKVNSDFSVLLEREQKQNVTTRVTLLPNLKLPLDPGGTIGKITAYIDGKPAASAPVETTVKVGKAGLLVRWWRAFLEFIKGLFGGKK